jgi:hypothetical protein
MYHVIWYEGWTENIHTFDTKDAAAQFIMDTQIDPDEFEILEDTQA